MNIPIMQISDLQPSQPNVIPLKAVTPVQSSGLDITAMENEAPQHMVESTMGLFKVVVPTMAAVGILGNTISYLVFSGKVFRLLRTSSLILRVMAGTDTSYLLVILLLSWLPLMSSFPMSKDNVLCKNYHLLRLWAINYKLSLVLCLCVDQMLALGLPRKYTGLVYPRFMQFCVVGLLVICGMYAFPHIFSYSVKTYHLGNNTVFTTCSSQWNIIFDFGHSINSPFGLGSASDANFSRWFALPQLMVMIVSVGFFATYATTDAKTLPPPRRALSVERQQIPANALAGMAWLSLVAVCTYLLLNISTSFNVELLFVLGLVSLNMYYRASLAFFLLISANHVIPFFLYVSCSRMFREGLKELFYGSPAGPAEVTVQRDVEYAENVLDVQKNEEAEEEEPFGSEVE